MSKKLRIVSGLLAALLLFSAAGCGKEGTESSDASSETTAPSDVSVSDNSTVSGEASATTASSGASNTSTASSTTSKTSGATNNLTPSKVHSTTKENFYDDIRGTTVKILEDNTKEIQQAIKAFEERYGCKVELTSDWSNWETKFAIQISSGNTIDCVPVTDDRYVEYLTKGKVQPVDPYIDVKDPIWNASIMNAHTYNGKHYVMFNSQRRYDVNWYIYYNEDLFEEEGEATPATLYQQGKWDYAAFLRAAEKMTLKSNGKTSRYGFTTNRYQLFGLTNGATLAEIGANGKVNVTMNNQATQNALQLIQDLKSKGYASYGENSIELFKEGQAAMVFTGPGEIGFQNNIYDKKVFPYKLGVAPTPKGPDTGNTHYAPSYQQSSGIPVKCKNPKGAAAWVYFLGIYQKEHENDKEMLEARRRTYSDEHLALINSYNKKMTTISYTANGFGNWRVSGQKFWDELLVDNVPPATLTDKYLGVLQADVARSMDRATIIS